jgi:anti-sigma regulatory factor (Ser/Thr protein kinase)
VIPVARFDVSVGRFVRPIAGESEAGDACGVFPWRRGVVVALADGLGHGARAAEPARAFLTRVQADPDLALPEIFSRAHRDLLRTRGAVAAVARVDQQCGGVEVAGIGNIGVMVLQGEDGRTVRGIMVPGVLGSSFRTVRSQALPLAAGDTLVMHSDGVRSQFDFGVVRGMAAQAGSERVVRTGGKPTDDAACVVLRASAPASTESASSDAAGPDDALWRMPIRMVGDAACAAAETRAYGARLGLSLRAQWEMSLVASELATNVLKFAGSGTMTLRRVDSPRAAMLLEMIDRGDGIADVGAAMVDGYSEGRLLSRERPRRPGQGLGVGLGTVHRMSDDVSIESGPRTGTRVTALKYLR